MVLVAATVVVVGAAMLALLALRWVPAQTVPVVTARDLDRDFTVAEQKREKAFRRRVRPWSLLGVGLDVVVPSVLVVSGAASWIAGRVASPWWLSVLAVTSVVLVAGRLLSLPGAVVVRRVSLEHGLATGPWRRWARDLAVGFAMSWVLACAAMVGLVAAVRVWPQTWWVPVAAAAGVLVVGLSFLVPVVVEPLFARFTPLVDGPLRASLLALAEADGVAVSDVLVADASRRTTALNAYVSGLGATRRVVVHDTLLDRGRDEEVRAVVAHELGHVVAHDVRTGTVLGAGGAVLAVAAAFVALSSSGVLASAHLSDAADPAVAALLLAAAAWAGLLGSPLSSALSRRIERRADQHCLDLATDPATVAAMHRSLAITNLASLHPPRLLHLWFGTHPTSPERIAAARAWAQQHGTAVPGDLVVAD